MLNRRLVGVSAGVLIAIGAAAWFLGCSAPIGGGGNAGLRLSSSKLNPGQFLTISHDGISVGQPVTVEFRGTAGAVVSVQSHDVEQGSVKVAVPAFLDFSTGAFGPGEYTVTLRGLTGEARLEVEDLPQVAGVEAGAVLRLFMAAAIKDYQATIDNLTAIQANLGGNGSTNVIADLNERSAALQAKVTELGSTGQLVVNLGSAGSVTLTSAELQTADRLLISMLVGFEQANPTTSKGSASHRSAGDCINIFNPPPDGRVACLEEVINDLRPAVATGFRWAGYVATVAGLTTALVAATPEVALTGLLIGVMGGVVGFGEAAAEAKNTDSFLQNAGDQFNADLEILSQFSRVLISAASTGFEALENLASDAATALDNFITLVDNFVEQKCANEGAPKRRPSAQCTDVCTFCEATRPPGCDNSCTLAFDGLCDDGGPGSFDGICALGTDCNDCGPRTDSVEPPPVGGDTPGCNNTCQFANDGTCDDGGTGSSSFLVVCFLGTDCADCGPRDVSVCSDTCSDAGDNICDDGGPGSSFAICELGTDCTDCGPRSGGDSPGPSPDVLGACCASDGTCALVTQAACTSPGSIFNSGIATCSPNPCAQPPPTGACCVSGACSSVTASECAALQGGLYSGDGTTCTTVDCAPPVEYVVWYTGNVSCWSAPLMYINTRDSFNTPESAASYPGGGIDFSVPLQKVELQGAFASIEEAQAWICPQFEMFFYHNWCSPHYFAMGQWWLPGGLGCDLSNVPPM